MNYYQFLNVFCYKINANEQNNMGFVFRQWSVAQYITIPSFGPGNFFVHGIYNILYNITLAENYIKNEQPWLSRLDLVL